jgi:hypothetical protein
MAVNPARELTTAEKDRIVREMVKSLPALQPSDLFTAFVTDPVLMVNQNASQQSQIADIAARQLLVAKAVSEIAKQIQNLKTQTGPTTNGPTAP